MTKMIQKRKKFCDKTFNGFELNREKKTFIKFTRQNF